MDSADPYSDGILKMPIVIDNVSEINEFNYWLPTYFFGQQILNNVWHIGLRSDQSRFQWWGKAFKDIRFIVSFAMI